MDNIDSIIEKINKAIGDKDYFYISNYVEHAQGFEKWIKNFKTVYLWNTDYAEYLTRKGIETYCFVKEMGHQDEVKSSAQILDFVVNNNLVHFKQGSFFQTFKISPKFSDLVEKLEGKVVNTSDELNRLFESKVSQSGIFDKYGISFPKTIVSKFKDFTYDQVKSLLVPSDATMENDVFVVQFNRGHTGNGTLFVRDKALYYELQRKFPQRTVRMSEFIQSPTYTINACATSKGIYMSGLCKQVSGVYELSHDMGATVGNNYAHGLSSSQILDLNEEINKLRKPLDEKGYRGMFGIDFMLKNGKVNILEINARQTMSVPFNCAIQQERWQVPIMLIHIAEFLGIDYEIDLQNYNTENTTSLEYSQLILRNKTGQDIVIKNEVRNGEYALQDGKLIYRNPQIYAEKIEDDNILVLTKKKDTRIAEGDEMARIQLKKNLYIENEVVDRKYVGILLDLDKQLMM
jgi:hypothetical protein